MKKTMTGLALAAAFGFTALAASPAAAAPPYANCDAAAAEGVYNIPQGQPGYARGLDRDKDGVACEADVPGGDGGVVVDREGPLTPTSTPTAPGGVVQTPKGGANTGVAQENGTDATGVLLAAGGVVAVAGIAAGLRRRSGNHT